MLEYLGFLVCHLSPSRKKIWYSLGIIHQRWKTFFTHFHKTCFFSLLSHFHSLALLSRSFSPRLPYFFQFSFLQISGKIFLLTCVIGCWSLAWKHFKRFRSHVQLEKYLQKLFLASFQKSRWVAQRSICWKSFSFDRMINSRALINIFFHLLVYWYISVLCCHLNIIGCLLGLGQS